MPSLHITQVKSGVGAPSTHRRTLQALGLKHQRSVIHDDTPAIRGMLFQVRHLIRVTATEGQGENG